LPQCVRWTLKVVCGWLSSRTSARKASLHDRLDQASQPSRRHSAPNVRPLRTDGAIPHGKPNHAIWPRRCAPPKCERQYAASRALVGRDLTMPSNTRRFRPSCPLMRRRIGNHSQPAIVSIIADGGERVLSWAYQPRSVGQINHRDCTRSAPCLQ
jgi:hypothetical protein